MVLPMSNGILVHEWLESVGGAERVVEAMEQAFPNTPLYALWNDAPEKYPNAHESWLARTPLRRHKAFALPMLPQTWRTFIPHQDGCEWVLVSTHLFAHHVKVVNTDGTLPKKYVYVHTPARYIWEPQLDVRGQSPLVRASAQIFKPLDRSRAKEAQSFAANSAFVKDRIQKAWHRDATVIYPPVDVKTITSCSWERELTQPETQLLDALPDEYILGASRFVPYKRLDWVIRAGEQCHTPVVIAGKGPEEEHLRALAAAATVPVIFVMRPSRNLLLALYKKARVYVFPAIEDFGIMPVEAQATGTPVVTTSFGGATESVQPGITGVISQLDSPESVGNAVQSALCLSKFSPPTELSERFDTSSFIKKIQTWVAGS